MANDAKEAKAKANAKAMAKAKAKAQDVKKAALGQQAAKEKDAENGQTQDEDLPAAPDAPDSGTNAAAGEPDGTAASIPVKAPAAEAKKSLGSYQY